MVLCVVIHRENIHQMPEILAMAEELGADYLELANTQYYGWAHANRDLLLPTKAQFQQAEAIAQAFKETVAGKMKIYYVVPDFYEDQKYIVNPNPVKTEKPFMEHNIKATLDAYDLKKIKIVDMPIKLDAVDDIQKWSTQKQFENIPVWDREILIDTYNQLQSIRPYYTFLSVDEDRYFLRDHTRQVNLAAREVKISKIAA